MKLLHIISSANPEGGGPIEGIKQRGIYLQAEGHTVEVACLDAPSAPHLATFPLPVHALGPTSLGGYAYTPRLRGWLKQHAQQYDHIVISGLWQHHGHVAARTLRRMGVPYHIFTHGMLDPWFKHAYPLKHLKKWAYWLAAEYHVLRHARTVLFTSEEERLRARRSFWLHTANEVLVPKVVARYGEYLAGKTFALWGLAFKPETDGLREAPSRMSMAALTRRGARIQTYDPVTRAEAQRLMPASAHLSYAANANAAREGADALIIVMEWKEHRTPDFEPIKPQLRHDLHR
jgi:hypothetical protein